MTRACAGVPVVRLGGFFLVNFQEKFFGQTISFLYVPVQFICSRGTLFQQEESGYIWGQRFVGEKITLFGTYQKAAKLIPIAPTISKILYTPQKLIQKTCDILHSLVFNFVAR